MSIGVGNARYSDNGQIYFPLPQTTNKNVEHDLSTLESAIAKKKYGKIIKDPDLFWLAFCKASSKIERKPYDLIFSIFIQEKTLTINGRKDVIFAIQQFIKEMQEFFIKNLDKKNNFTILPILSGTNYYISEKAKIIDIIDLTEYRCSLLPRVSITQFENYIRPCMEAFCRSIGASCSNTPVSQKISFHSHFSAINQEIEAFEINWVKEKRFIYPIDPVKIPPRENLQQSMHSLYRENILCDFSVIAKDGALQVHSVIFFTYGGKIIQNMFTHKTKESAEKTISFTDFSLSTVKAFVDFLYLGEKAFEPEAFLERNVNLYELFTMAHLYQVEPLIDSCTNLISLFSDIEDLEEIKHLVNIYQNKHLEELYKHLTLQANGQKIELIKV
ncbi:MAG: BTB/POZ domain-containing protein [Chlamydiales bacterium]|nr:BTB/POZ domain-containing protein [Chlamydiales bacterium]